MTTIGNLSRVLPPTPAMHEQQSHHIDDDPPPPFHQNECHNGIHDYGSDDDVFRPLRECRICCPPPTYFESEEYEKDKSIISKIRNEASNVSEFVLLMSMIRVGSRY